MKRIILTIAAAVFTILGNYEVSAQTTTFAYQGTLNLGGAPANGSFDFEFRLYDALSGGGQIGTTNTFNAVAVRNGQFTVTLSFGANAFPGAERWIQISVRQAGGGSFTILLPRQAVTATPYAITSFKAVSLTGTLAIAGGGTGATDAATARGNLGAAASGANGDIKSLSGLTTPLSVAQGGTSATSASAARVSLGAAGSGANSDITALTGLITPLGIGQGGTGATTAASARASIGAAGSGANADITSISGLTTPLSVAQGGTGISTSPNTSGQFLRSNVAGEWSVSRIAQDDLPNLSTSYVDLKSSQTIEGNKIFTGIIFGNGNGLTGIKGTLSWEIQSANFQSVSNKAYIVDSPVQVTITLPLNPGIGDIIKIVGYGSGSWRIAPNNGQIVKTVIDSLSNIVSPDWIPRESDRTWTDITSSDDGVRLAAAAYGGYLYLSSDSGDTWIPRDQIRAWTSIASSSDGRILAATVDNGQIYVSDDWGLNWTPRATNRQWRKIAISADGQHQIATSDTTYISSDSGVTWKPSLSGWFPFIATSTRGDKIIATLPGGLNNFCSSNDYGDHWNCIAANTSLGAVTISGDSTASYVVGNPGPIYEQTSSDLSVPLTPLGSMKQWVAIASSDDGRRIIAAENGGKLFTSSDAGHTWIARESNRNWNGVTSSADGRKLAAIVRNGKIYTYSEINGHQVQDGKYLAGSMGASIEIVYVGNGTYILVSAMGTIFLT